MPNAFAFGKTVLRFSHDRHLANEESLSSSYIECEEIENRRNHLTWGYSKKLSLNRKKSGKTLAIPPKRGIIAKPSDEGAPAKGGTESASGPPSGARGRKRKLSQKSP